MDERLVHFGLDMPTLADVPSETVAGALGLVVIQKDVLRLVKSIPRGRWPKDGSGFQQSFVPFFEAGMIAPLTFRF